MKNTIITLLLIGLLISLYFNYSYSDKVHIAVGKDALKITFFGIDKIKDSLAPAAAEAGALNNAGSILVPTFVCPGTSGTGVLTLPCKTKNDKQGVVPHPGVWPRPADQVLAFVTQNYKEIVVGIEVVHDGINNDIQRVNDTGQGAKK